MSGRHPTEKECARQADELAALKQRQTPQNKGGPDDDELEALVDAEPLDRNGLYTTRQLMRAMAIGRKLFNAFMGLGLPHTLIKGRYYFSGRLVIEFIEGLTDGGKVPVQR